MPKDTDAELPPPFRDSTWFVALATAVLFLAGYVRQLVYYAQLGVAKESLDFTLQDYMFESVQVVLVPILAMFVGLLSRAVGHWAYNRWGIAAARRMSLKRNKRSVPSPVSLPILAFVVACGAFAYHAVLSQGYDNTQGFAGLRPLDVEYIAGVSLFVILRSVLPILHRFRKYGRTTFVAFGTLALILLWLAAKTKRLDLSLVCIFGVILLFVTAIPRPIGGIGTFRLRKANQAYYAFVAVYFIVVAAILQGYHEGQSAAKGCEPVNVIHLEPASILPANDTYWLVLHAKNVYHLRDTNVSIAKTVIVSESQVTSATLDPKQKLLAC